MGNGKAGKKINKIKKCCRKPLEKGESYDDKSPNFENNEGDVAEADMKAFNSKKSRKNKRNNSSSVVANDANAPCKREKRKSKKAHKEDGHSANKKSKLELKEVQEVAMPDVYEISLGEEDDSKGMKKWVKEYHEKRPGLKVLQERIDDFITAHEEQEEQTRKEREAKLSEDGWTVVVHRKGGKRTTDAESGVAVGAVAEAAVRDKMAKKKNKDFGLDFYRFQRKEAQRSEIMKLQSKFEEDKKRIQQVRAARKFRPY